MNQTLQFRPDWGRVQRVALIAGVALVAVAAIGALVSGGFTRFLQSYLFAFLFTLAFPLGGLALLMVQHMAGGTWGAIIRRPVEAAALTTPLMVLLFLPILLGLNELYLWSLPHDEIVGRAGAEVAEFVEHKLWYLNTPGFIIRALIYFAIWSGLALLLNRMSEQQDRTGDPRLIGQFKLLSGIGIIAYFLAMTFAAVDWGMSIDPLFFSSIYGAIFAVSQGLTIFAFTIIVLRYLSERPPLAGIVTRTHFHDLGKFMLGFVILWTYVNLSQFIITWSGNLPEEIPWYITRGEHGWDVLSVVVVAFQFFLPFFILLSRRGKQNARWLAVIAAGILVMRLVDLFWMIMPSFYEEFSISWLDIVLPLGLLGIWVAAFLWALGRKPLLPLRDPRLHLDDVYPAEPAPARAAGRPARARG